MLSGTACKLLSFHYITDMKFRLDVDDAEEAKKQKEHSETEPQRQTPILQPIVRKEKRAFSPLMKVFFWLAWIAGLALFLFGAGLSFVGGAFIFGGGVDHFLRDFARDPFIISISIVFVGGSLILFILALIRSIKSFLRRTSLGKIMLYLLGIPALAAFIWGAGCMMILNA